MFLTTESTITGRPYTSLRVIHTCVYATTWTKNLAPTPHKVEEGVESAFAKIAQIASQLQADGVIGIHHSIGGDGSTAIITVMGTAIKF